MRIALIASLLCVAQAKHLRHRGPVIDLRGADQLTATIREDELVLNTVPDLSIVAESGPVCKYLLTSADGPVPFLAEVVDRFSGAAVLRVKEANSLDCKRPSYSITVQAVRCDDETNVSEPVPLKVTVKDTNNHSPEFDSPWYTFHVDEGRIHNEIATLKATDADCGDPFGEICEYRITNGLSELPFVISNRGVLKNTAPLNYTAVKSYILTVVAIDCGMRESKSALVTVHVNEACVPGFSKIGERVEFTPGASDKVLVPEVEAKLCATENHCEVEGVEATVALHASHITSGCARDTLFDNATIKNCGLNPNTAALLPAGKTSGASFDGATNAIVVSDVASSLVPDHFTLSFSMKHARGSKEEQANKQHVLCESDETEMNRHHFSVYVRHCKLEVVLRREAGASAEFRAAEWRWGIDQVCDNQWHSYSLLFNGVDDVQLMLDGQQFKADERNPEILDDWPLHKTSAAKTKLVVGACWHGRQQAMAQFFNGELAAVHLLTGVAESKKAIECTHQCKEKLSVDEKDFKEGETSTWSADRQTVTLKAATAERLNAILKNVAYSNAEEKTSLGHRSFSVNGQALCKGGKTVELPSVKGYVFVQKEEEPTLSISGSALINADHIQVKQGTPMIPDIKITVSKPNSDGEVKDITEDSKLDYCKVHLKPSRDMDLEYFSSPASLIAALQIDFEHDKEGILLRGEESVAGYLQVLSKVHYFNTRPDTYSKRIYSVQCAMHKGKVVSNEFVVTMTITGAEGEDSALPSISAEDTLEMMERHFEPAFDQLGSSRLQNILEMDLPRPKALMSHHGYDVGQGAIAGGAVAVVVVICVGFLLVLLVVGVLKMRDVPGPRKRKNRRQDDGMHWDDSGMNITVNPLEDVEKSAGDVDFSDEDDEDDDSSDNDSECSFHDEEVSDDEEAHEVLPHLDGPRSGLEWDDEAALTPNTRSYRV